jgi:hypothetical protein
MAYSIQTAVSNGTLDVLDLSIKYMDKSHIQVYIDDVLADGTAYSYVWLTDTRIQIVPAVANGSTLKVIRKTLTDEMWHEFTQGARFSTTSMDENFEQLLFLAQEYSEGIYVSDFYTDLDLHLKRITNLGDAVSERDAVNLKVLREYLPYGPAATSLDARITAEEQHTQQLSGPYGSGLVDGVTIAELRAYTGSATRLQLVDGSIVLRQGTAADDGGMTWKDGLNRSWERELRGFADVLWFGADPRYFPGADNLTKVQLAVNKLAASGGGVLRHSSGIYLGPDGLVVPAGVRIVGENRESTILRKTTASTKTLTIYSGALVVYNDNPLPSAINAVVALVGAGGRYKGGITDITMEGVYGTVGNYESQLVEFGVVSTGSVSDFTLENTYTNCVRYGLVLPTIFSSVIQNNRFTECLQGTGIDGGTSLTYSSNYCNNCRDGHFIRGLQYSGGKYNAADYTNDPAKFPDRTKVRFAYRFRSLVCCDFSYNGNEQTWGRSYWLETLDNCAIKHNLTIGVGSDYTGSAHIAVIYSDGVLRDCELVGNLGYNVKAGGLLYGGANPSLHHNMYFESTSFVIDSTVKGNRVRTSLSGIPVEAGWGNNQPSNWVNGTTNADIAQTFNPTLTANSVGNLVVTYGAGNKHYLQTTGNFYKVFGCFDVTLTYTTASSYLIFQGFPANQGIPWRIQITGVDNDGALPKKLGSFVLNANQGNGIAFDENGNTFAITDLPSGTSIKIYYEGTYAKA